MNSVLLAAAATSILVFAGSAYPLSAAAQEADSLVFPTAMTISGAEGNPIFAVPVRLYSEVQYGVSRSDPALADVVDYRGLRLVVGADFISSGPWLWGLSLAYTHATDDGRSPFATIETEKNAKGIGFYIAKPVLPNITVGSSFSYERVTGQSVYNGVDVNNEESDSFGLNPFITITHPLTETLSAQFRPNLRYQHGGYSYDLNIPPTAETSRTSLHLPVTLTYDVTPRLSVSGTAGLNLTLAENTFPNVPDSSDVTVTVGAGLSYDFGNGMSLYGSVNHVLFDEHYTSTSSTLGLSTAF